MVRAGATKMKLLTMAACAAVLGIAAQAWAAPPPTLSAEAFEYAQMAAGSRAAAALARSSARMAATDPALADLAAAREDAEARWTAVDARRLQSLGDAAPTAQAQSAALATLEQQLAAEVARDDAELARRFPAFVDITSPAPLPLAELQRLLGPTEALVLILPTASGTYVWGVSHGSSRWVRAAITDANLTQDVADLRASLDPTGLVRAGVDASGSDATAPLVRSFPRALAFSLYQQLWEPVSPALGHAETVYVVASGPLSSLPFSVLPTAAPSGSDADAEALRATPWLFRRHALAVLPSVSSLRALRRAGARPAVQRPFAGFGDPSLGGATKGWARNLEPLPGSRRELMALAVALHAPSDAVFTGPAATEAAVRAAPLADVRVVAFATHGLLAGETGALNEPALVPPPPADPQGDDDGLLTATEAASLHLSADWVVLSACNTAAGDGKGGLAFGGEGLSGLARAFFHAGARALLVSHWRVRDEAAARLTTDTIRAYAAHPEAGRAQALRLAMETMLTDRSDPSLAQPSAWAPFVVAGEGR